MTNLVKTASEYITKFLSENLPKECTYHNLTHTYEVFENVTELSENSNLPDEDLEIVQLAALFHDTGFTKGYLNHENKSIEIVKKFLKNVDYGEIEIVKVTDIIKITKRGSIPVHLSEKIMKDADILHISKEDFYPRSLTLKSEWESVDHKHFSETEWIQSSLDFIQRTLFYTEYASLKYEPGRQRNIQKLNEMIKQLQT